MMLNNYQNAVTVACRGDLEALPTSTLYEMARAAQWVHTIDLGNGEMTRGAWGRGNPEISKAFDTIDFAGKIVLDIGCWDGQWAFEAETRGASEIIAIDLVSQRDFNTQRTFEIAAVLRKSKALYFPELSVYDIGRLEKKFDIILYMGIIYHLKDPLLSLSEIRCALKEGGQVVFESAVLEEEGCYAKFFYEDSFCGDTTNWWVPTRKCMRQWAECSFLQTMWEGEPWGHLENQRHCIVSKAISHKDPLYGAPPERLEQYWK